MVKKKKMKVAFAAFAGVMFFGGLAFSPNKSQAAKKVSITKSVKVYEGKNEKICLLYTSISLSGLIKSDFK